jgi:hypothetical protein
MSNDTRATAERLARSAAEASDNFKTKSPDPAKLAALASIALSLSRIADALESR